MGLECRGQEHFLGLWGYSSSNVPTDWSGLNPGLEDQTSSCGLMGCGCDGPGWRTDLIHSNQWVHPLT